MFLSLSLFFFFDSLTTSILCFLLFQSVLQMIGVFHSNLFLLDLLKRTSTKFDRANVSVLKADCVVADFTKTAPFEEETRAGKTLLPFSPSRSEDRYFRRNIQRQRGADSTLLGLKMTSWKRKASKPGGFGGNAKVRIIRMEIYCTYSKAVTPFLLHKSYAVLIKEVDHFPELWHEMWLPFSRPKQVVIKNFIRQSVERQKLYQCVC